MCDSGLSLAKGYLERALKFLKTGDYSECVEASQLAAENAAKAVVALKRIPSWTHDPSDELLDIVSELPENSRCWIEELANLVRELAPEHGLVTYGKLGEGLAPWELYDRAEAQGILEKAKRAVELMESVLRLITRI